MILSSNNSLALLRLASAFSRARLRPSKASSRIDTIRFCSSRGGRVKGTFLIALGLTFACAAPCASCSRKLEKASDERKWRKYDLSTSTSSLGFILATRWFRAAGRCEAFISATRPTFPVSEVRMSPSSSSKRFVCFVSCTNFGFSKLMSPS